MTEPERPDDERLVEQWVGGPPGMPPFPGLDLLDSDDHAFWYGDGSGGHQLTGGASLEVASVERVGKVDYDRVQEAFRELLGAPPPAGQACPHGDDNCSFGSGACDCAR